jgi:hypothetical protein
MNFFTTTHLKPATYNTYNTRLNKWISLFKEEQASLVFVYTHPNYATVTIRNHLKTTGHDTPMTMNCYVKAIMSATEHNLELFQHISKEQMQKSDKRWKELRQITYNQAFAYRMEQEPSKGQSEKSGVSLTLKDLIHKRDSMKEGSMDQLLVGFYTYLPPVRADYYATQIVKQGEQPTEPNYIEWCTDRSRVVITDFKTARLYKEITNDLPNELHRILTISLTNQPRTYLFVNKEGNPFTRNGFSIWASNRLLSIFQKGLTLTMLRHIYISSLDFNLPPSALKQIGDKMGHHLSQQLLYKWKTDSTVSE